MSKSCPLHGLPFSSTALQISTPATLSWSSPQQKSVAGG
uniref:Uncharacterized protein n=1 Tax=Arundo donax TaxID=35708 RepID=A0A0A8YL00_ARUDO